MVKKFSIYSGDGQTPGSLVACLPPLHQIETLEIECSANSCPLTGAPNSTLLPHAIFTKLKKLDLSTFHSNPFNECYRRNLFSNFNKDEFYGEAYRGIQQAIFSFLRLVQSIEGSQVEDLVLFSSLDWNKCWFPPRDWLSFSDYPVFPTKNILMETLFKSQSFNGLRKVTFKNFFYDEEEENENFCGCCYEKRKFNLSIFTFLLENSMTNYFLRPIEEFVFESGQLNFEIDDEFIDDLYEKYIDDNDYIKEDEEFEKERVREEKNKEREVRKFERDQKRKNKKEEEEKLLETTENSENIVSNHYDVSADEGESSDEDDEEDDECQEELDFDEYYYKYWNRFSTDYGDDFIGTDTYETFVKLIQVIQKVPTLKVITMHGGMKYNKTCLDCQIQWQILVEMMQTNLLESFYFEKVHFIVHGVNTPNATANSIKAFKKIFLPFELNRNCLERYYKVEKKSYNRRKYLHSFKFFLSNQDGLILLDETVETKANGRFKILT